MRILFFAVVASALMVTRAGYSNANDDRTEKLRDRITEAAEKLQNDQLSPDERHEILNDLRRILNTDLADSSRQSAERPIAKPESRPPSTHPQPPRREPSAQRQHAFEHFERARREFEETMQRLESLQQPEFERPGFERPGDVQRPWGNTEPLPPGEPPRFDDRRTGRGDRRPETRFAIGLLLILRENAAQPGVEIASIPADSAAAETGLRAGDVIHRADGQRVENAHELTQRVQIAGREGRSIKLTIRRGEEELVFGVRPRELTNSPGDLERSMQWWQHWGPQGPAAFAGPNRWVFPPHPPAITGSPQPPHQPEHELNQVREELQRMRREINELREMLKKSIDPKANAPVIDL